MKLFKPGCRPATSRLLSAIAALALTTTAHYNGAAQTLFTYGRHAVTKDEFLKAYNKNNGDSSVSQLTPEQYLELYTAFRLKVQAALDAHMDTLASQRAELKAFHDQLAESFLQEEASTDLLVKEAFDRSLKDVHLAQVLIPVPSGADVKQIDSMGAIAQAVQEKIRKGADPRQAGEREWYSDLGWITAFTLAYPYENIAYSTPAGQPSAPFRSTAGYHILINAGHRKAAGKVKVAQILLAFRPGATDSTKKVLSARADSIYRALRAGASFDRMVTTYSDDNTTYQNGGELPPFGIGEYDSSFERQAFALDEDSAISKPFRTTFGIHILKRIQRIPVIEDPNNKDWQALLRDRVLASDRMQAARTVLISNIRSKIAAEAPPEVMNDDSAVLPYYRQHLETYRPEFAEQVQEFRQGNLLFGIMQQKIWDAAAADTIGLRKYYTRNKSKYAWESSADAIIITAPDTTDLIDLQKLLKAGVHNWRTIAARSNGAIQADSGRFDLSLIPVVDRTNFTEGLMTAPVRNSADKLITAAYIVKVYKGNQPKSFDDAIGAVLTDYQDYLEQQWLANLRKKYPVKVNKKLMQELAHK